jgi:hypothetical protein
VLCADAEGVLHHPRRPSAQQEGTTVFNWDVIEHEAKNDPWEFEADGKKWRLPHINDLTIGQQIAADRGRLELVFNEVAEVQEVTKAGSTVKSRWKPAGAEGAELITGKHPDQVGVLKIAWMAHAGMEPGESPASSS